MEPITLRLPDDLLESLDEEAAERAVSRSEYIRKVLETRGDYDALRDEYDALRDEYDALRDEYEQRIADLQAEHEQRVEQLEAEHEREIERLQRDYEQRTDELRDRIERLETDVERLQNEKRMILKQREQNQELQRYVEDELAYREAGLGKRLKWWAFGRQRDED